MTFLKIPRCGAVTVCLCLSVALSGCGLFKRNVPYADSQEAGTLVVPGELDRPTSDPSLSLPPGGTAGVLLDEEARKPPEIGAQTSGIGGGSVGPGFTIAFSSSEVYGAIGTLLEGMSEYTIRSRDPVQGVFRLQTEVVGEAQSRWKFWSNPKPVRAEMVVRVARLAEGSQVSVEAASGGRAGAARAAILLDTLREGLRRGG